MVTGSYPPDVCGVGDSTFRLVSALQKMHVNVEVISNVNWATSNFLNVKRHISEINPDIIHIQYPTVGYGYHITPQILSLFFPTITTLHEVSQSNILRQWALYPFSIASRHLVFTSEYERKYACIWAPWVESRSKVIPIGSNILTGIQVTKPRLEEVIYFGLIRSNKGLEDFIEVASLAKARKLNIGFRVIGMIDAKSHEYYTKLSNQTLNLPITWSIGLSHSEVADYLSKSSLAYLPFPDGVSERRGSLLAALSNSVAVVTTKGTHTPSVMQNAVAFADNPNHALGIITKLIADSNQLAFLQKAGYEYAQQFSWDIIAKKHIALYNSIFTGIK